MPTTGLDPNRMPPQERSRLRLYFAMPIFAWAMYDFANTIFSSNIVTIFYPLYLKQILGGNEQLNQVASTFVAYTNAIASIFLVLLSPLYGVWIDRTGRKKPFLVAFTLICIAATTLMGVSSYLSTGQTLFGLPLELVGVLLLFMVATFAYSSSLVFYDPMMSDIGRGRELPLISGFGVALGYVGTLVGLSVFPLSANDQYHHTFIPSAGLFLLFSLPIFFLYKEQRPSAPSAGKRSFLSGYAEIWGTFKEMRTYKPLLLYMIAYFLFNDAITTTISMMSVYSSTMLGMSTGQFIILYLVSTVAAIIGSFLFGHITRAIGSKHAATIVALLLIVALLAATVHITEPLFWTAGVLYGIAMGALWVTSRTLIIELSPPEKRGQFFGLFAFSGKVSSIVGPVLYGTITLLFQDMGNTASRLALGSLAVLVVIGLLVHMKVPYSRPR